MAKRTRPKPDADSSYRRLVASVSDYGIVTLDPAGTITSWNAGAQRFTGYAPVEIINQPISRLYIPEERTGNVPETALRIAADSGRHEREGWQVRKDGERFWAHVAIDSARTPDGELAGFAMVTRDLTQRRQAEESQRRTQEQFRLLVQGVTDYAIFMLDPEGRVASWNAGAQRIKGYLPDEIIGQHFSRFYTDADRETGVPFEGLDTARREGRWEREGLRVRKDGSTFWAHVVIDAIRDDRGNVIGFAKVTRDITERRDAQLALERSREALFQSQKMEALGQLTGGVAHDFNNLLMAALSSLELLRKRMPKDPRLTALSDIALQAIERGGALTDRMLAFARRQALELAPIDTVALLRAMHRFLQRSIGPRVRVEMNIPAELPAALSDANQLESAILNLVLNARDAIGGAGVVRIAARSARPTTDMIGLSPGDYVVLSVSDEGEGMEPEILARAIEPFFSTKGPSKGTGLGLSMVQGLAAQSAGALILQSRKGEGTTAEIWLPTSGEAPVRPTQRNGVAARDPRLVILLVDDDSLVLSNTGALLEDLGHFVVRASSGAEALEVLDIHPDIDIIITDQAMPHMTGGELAKQVGQRRSGLPVLLATGYVDLETPTSHLLKLKKPFTQDQLRDALANATVRSAQPRSRVMPRTASASAKQNL